MFNISSFTIGFIAGFTGGYFSKEIAKKGKSILEPKLRKIQDISQSIIDKTMDNIAEAGEALEDYLAEKKNLKKSVEVKVNRTEAK